MILVDVIYTIQDTWDVDVCDIVSGVIDAILNITGSNIICKLAIEEEVRVIGKLIRIIRICFLHQLTLTLI